MDREAIHPLQKQSTYCTPVHAPCPVCVVETAAGADAHKETKRTARGDHLWQMAVQRTALAQTLWGEWEVLFPVNWNLPHEWRRVKTTDGRLSGFRVGVSYVPMMLGHRGASDCNFCLTLEKSVITRSVFPAATPWEPHHLATQKELGTEGQADLDWRSSS